MEDIKILKNIIEQDFSNPMGWSGYYDSELKELQQAIKNLIKAYKEDEAVIEEMAKYIKNPYEVITIGSRKPKIEIIKEYFRNKVKENKE